MKDIELMLQSLCILTSLILFVQVLNLTQPEHIQTVAAQNKRAVGP